MLGRYHTMSDGKRQYISLHIAGDWADAQGLFLDHMDHSICAMETASVYSIPHLELFKLFKERPQLGFVVWRETLIDAAIFRMTITNNSSRHGMARLAHFFAELYYRAKAVELVSNSSCSLPLSQTQLGETLGMSIATVNRNLQKLRRSGPLTGVEGG
jgi:CRP-like cAMP-binding protein